MATLAIPGTRLDYPELREKRSSTFLRVDLYKYRLRLRQKEKKINNIKQYVILCEGCMCV